MTRAGKDHGQYVRKVQEDTLRHSKELLAENERLRVRVAALEADLAAQASRLGALDDVTRLQSELDAARDQLRRHQAQHADLQQRLAAAEEEGQRFSQEYSSIERQHSNLANLYVASYRLHDTLDRQELDVAIQEILANLVGCEEAAIFEVEGSRLRLTASFGVDREPLLDLPLGSGIIGRTAVTGEVFIGTGAAPGAEPYERTLTACVPMTLAGRVSGVIALFRLLSHKGEWTDIDRELLDLLASQAGPALYCAKLHALHSAAPELEPRA